MTEENQLLCQYAHDHNESAFAELVNRHLNLVYSTAFRRLQDVELAKDVTQVVFAELANKSRTLCKDVRLPGWLYQHTCFVASKSRRAEARRQRREEKVMQTQEPSATEESDRDGIGQLLDDAMQCLRAEERDALVLRFFHGNSFRAVGDAFGINDNAARMRIERSLEKLRLVLAKRGVTSSSTAIAAALATLITSAPEGLAAVVASCTAGASAIGMPGIQTIYMTKLTTTIGAAVLAAGIATPVLVRNKIGRVEKENTELRQQLGELTELRGQNERLSKLTIDSQELERLRLEHGEMFRLRGELALLRGRLRDVDHAGFEQNHIPLETGGGTAGLTNDVRSLSPGYYEAKSWADSGLGSPQNSSLTFLWSLRNGFAREYSNTLGKTNILQLPLEWANALGKVKGSQISETMTSAEGQPMVGILHEFEDGTTTNSWLSFRNLDGKWLVDSMIGYPIQVFQAAQTSAR